MNSRKVLISCLISGSPPWLLMRNVCALRCMGPEIAVWHLGTLNASWPSWLVFWMLVSGVSWSSLCHPGFMLLPWNCQKLRLMLTVDTGWQGVDQLTAHWNLLTASFISPFWSTFMGWDKWLVEHCSDARCQKTIASYIELRKCLQLPWSRPRNFKLNALVRQASGLYKLLVRIVPFTCLKYTKPNVTYI